MNEVLNRDTTEWHAADGRSFLIKELTVPHLVNILNWIKKHRPQYDDSLYPFLEEEASLRRFNAWVSNGPIPAKQADGTYRATNMPFTYHCKALYYKYKTELKMKFTELKQKTWLSKRNQRIRYLRAKKG